MTQQNDGAVPNVEQWIGLNVRRLREARVSEGGWSLEDVARHLTDNGAPMNKGSLSRIERGAQRVKYAEANAFARLFGVQLTDLAQPPEIAANADLVDAVNKWAAAGDALRDVAVRFSEASAAAMRAQNFVSELLDAGGLDRDRVLSQLQSVIRQIRGKEETHVDERARTWYAALFLGKDTEEPAVRAWIENGGEFPNG